MKWYIMMKQTLRHSVSSQIIVTIMLKNVPVVLKKVPIMLNVN